MSKVSEAEFGSLCKPTNKKQGVLRWFLMLRWLYGPYKTPGGGGVLPYIGYIGMCGPKGYGFSAVLVINRVSILADFGHFGRK